MMIYHNLRLQPYRQGLVRGNQNLLHFSCLEDLYISLSRCESNIVHGCKYRSEHLLDVCSERALQSILLTPNVVHSNSSTSYGTVNKRNSVLVVLSECTLVYF